MSNQDIYKGATCKTCGGTVPDGHVPSEFDALGQGHPDHELKPKLSEVMTNQASEDDFRRTTDWQWLTEVLSRFDITDKYSLSKNARDFTSLEARLYREIQNRYKQRKKPDYVKPVTGGKSSKQYEDSKRLFSKQINTMHEMGYGLMLDGFTFYKYGYELEPYDFEINFNMHQAYELHDYIRTEKLKLLAEVRERVVGSLEPQNENGLLPDRVDRRNQLRTEQLEVLSKLEAEL